MNHRRLLPAYPLFVKDPYFSFWKCGEILNEGNVSYWYGSERKIYGVLKIDGKPYGFLGEYGGIDKMRQQSLSLTAFTTDYTFTAEDVRLGLSFVSPLPPDDMSTLSCPVCYLNYKISSGTKHAFEIALFVSDTVCFNDDARSDRGGVVGGVFDLGTLRAAWCGAVRQAPLSVSADNVGAEWGYWYLAGENARFTTEEGIRAYLGGGEIPPASAESARSGKQYLLSFNRSESGKIMMAFDDIVACSYFGEHLKDYYFSGGKTVIDALKETFSRSAEIDRKLALIDEQLKKRCEPFGEDYLLILYASFRQSIAMHKLVKDRDGNVLFLSREANSNSCIATVDVSYPSVPLFLLYDTEYVKGMMRPIFRFARTDVWTFGFAPHDGGVYPNCDGQHYGLSKTVTEEHCNYLTAPSVQFVTRPATYYYPASFDAYDLYWQMPVEECANMIVMTAACCRVDGDTAFFDENGDLLAKWARYLEENGEMPSNQICTDDFAGHLDKNVNLAVKAAVALGCYADLCGKTGRDKEALHYSLTARKFADGIEKFARKYDRCPLTFDGGGETFSLKYNLAFDKILGLGLFSPDFYERETDAYLACMNRFGVPLDSRRTYTKSDWLMWTASLTEQRDKRGKFIEALARYLRETPSRIPFSDWYDTVTGESCMFIARTVQGANFILLLKDYLAGK